MLDSISEQFGIAAGLFSLVIFITNPVTASKSWITFYKQNIDMTPINTYIDCDNFCKEGSKQLFSRSSLTLLAENFHRD
jgi:hypothetical protein